MRLLLDTSVIIDFLRRKDKEISLLTKIAKGENELSISIITHTELFSGKSVWEQQKLFQAIEILCSGWRILPLEEDISTQAGKLRAHATTSLVDAIIAATAIQYSLELVTLNRKDFEKIKGLKLFEI